jgi:ubiquinone/menaquinone biosynthesis C-methylase UbiE
MGQMEQEQPGENGAEMYKRYLVPAIFAPWAAILVEKAGLEEGERVLDLACGTGVVARLSAQQFGPTGKVIGLDNNAGSNYVRPRPVKRRGLA